MRSSNHNKTNSNHIRLPSIEINVDSLFHSYTNVYIDSVLCACVRYSWSDGFGQSLSMNFSLLCKFSRVRIYVFIYVRPGIYQQHTGIVRCLNNDRSSPLYRKCYCLISNVAFIQCAWFFLVVYSMYAGVSKNNDDGHRDSTKLCFPFRNIRQSNIFGLYLYIQRSFPYMDLIRARWAAILNVS